MNLTIQNHWYKNTLKTNNSHTGKDMVCCLEQAQIFFLKYNYTTFSGKKHTISDSTIIISC